MYWFFVFLAGIALILILKQVLFPKDGSRAAQLMNTYRRMTPDLLASTPDDELIAAVAANLLSHAEAENREPYAVIPKLSPERCAVYSIWAVRRELESGDAASLRHAGQFGFSELAADGLAMLGENDAAAHLRDYLQTASDEALTALTEHLPSAEMTQKLVMFIRDNAAAFCDD